MDRMTLERRAEHYALQNYLTEWDTSTFDDIREAFYNNKIPDDVIIWQPFETFDLADVADYIEMTRNDFIQFADEILDN